MVIPILLLLATLIQGKSTVTYKVGAYVMPAAAYLLNPLFVPLSTHEVKSEVLPFFFTWFNQTSMTTTDVDPQMIGETAEEHHFFVALSVATAITAVIVAPVLVIFVLFLSAGYFFEKECHSGLVLVI